MAFRDHESCICHNTTPLFVSDSLFEKFSNVLFTSGNVFSVQLIITFLIGVNTSPVITHLFFFRYAVIITANEYVLVSLEPALLLLVVTLHFNLLTLESLLLAFFCEQSSVLDISPSRVAFKYKRWCLTSHKFKSLRKYLSCH